MDVFLIRMQESNQGTFSKLISPEIALNIHLLELPNRDNEVGFSRIPAGNYKVKPYKSPKFGKCWMVCNVPGRSYILFHKGNLAGDTRKGYKTHSRGCLLPGWYKGKIGLQNAILNSTKAFSEMVNKIGIDNSFNLKIIEL